MNAANQMLRYQQQAIVSASPEQLILKLYDIGISACHRQDRTKLRAVLVELIGALNMEAGGEVAERLLGGLPKDQQQSLRRVLRYPVGTAGEIMDPAVFALPDDIAVAEARDGLCVVCHVRLRPQVFNEVRRNDGIVQCDSCTRILYYVPPAAQASAQQR